MVFDHDDSAQNLNDERLVGRFLVNFSMFTTENLRLLRSFAQYIWNRWDHSFAAVFGDESWATAAQTRPLEESEARVIRALVYGNDTNYRFTPNRDHCGHAYCGTNQ